MANLEELDLGGNTIGDAGMTAFADAVSSGALDTSSVSIYLSNNPISQSSKDKIESAMANKSCSVHF